MSGRAEPGPAETVPPLELPETEYWSLPVEVSLTV